MKFLLNSLFLAAFSILVSVSIACAGEGSCSGAPIDPVYPLPCFKPIVPSLGCVDQNDDGTFTVGWGYNNLNLACCPAQILPVRTDLNLNGNDFSPAPIDRGQPVQTIAGQTGMVLSPGVHTNVFSTTWDGSPLTWNIRSFVITNSGPEVLNQSVTASGENSQALCPNFAPVCQLAPPAVATVTGRISEIHLDASASTDPENRAISFSWQINCNDAPSAVDITGTNTATPIIRLSGPGEGRTVSCNAQLQIHDVRNTTTCAQTAQVLPLDCQGISGGSAVVDSCGVCGGNNSCLDCAGVPFGGAVFDRCQVCGGNGQSCLNCTDTDQVGSLIAIDSNAGAQKAVVDRAAKTILASRKASSSDKRAAKNAVNKAKQLYVQNWTISWTLPPVAVSCTNATFCATQDNSVLLSSYSSNANALRNVGRDLAARMKRFDKTRAERTSKDATKQYKIAINGIKGIPAKQSQCS